MEFDTLEDWRALVRQIAGMVALNPRGSISTRILRRRIPGLTQERAELLLAAFAFYVEASTFSDVLDMMDDRKELT